MLHDKDYLKGPLWAILCLFLLNCNEGNFSSPTAPSGIELPGEPTLGTPQFETFPEVTFVQSPDGLSLTAYLRNTLQKEEHFGLATYIGDMQDINGQELYDSRVVRAAPGERIELTVALACEVWNQGDAFQDLPQALETPHYNSNKLLKAGLFKGGKCPETNPCARPPGPPPIDCCPDGPTATSSWNSKTGVLEVCISECVWDCGWQCRETCRPAEKGPK